MLMSSNTAESGNHGVQLMETDHSESGGELQSLGQHVTDMRNPLYRPLIGSPPKLSASSSEDLVPGAAGAWARAAAHGTPGRQQDRARPDAAPRRFLAGKGPYP